MQEDYLLKQLKDVSKVLAVMLGLAKKGDVKEALELSVQTLKVQFNLLENFSENDIIELLENKKLSVDDLKQLLSLMLERGNLLASESPEAAASEYHKCLIIIELIEKYATIYDLNLVQIKRGIEAKISI
jgi:aryl-alcohol dehydrogenase-like predicted oxidoreductase